MITNRPRNCSLAIVSWNAKEEGENITHIVTVACVTEFCCDYATRIVHVSLSKMLFLIVVQVLSLYARLGLLTVLDS